MEDMELNNKIVAEDLSFIFNALSESEKLNLKNSNILITGCAGFLGFYICNFFLMYAKELNIKSVIGTDIFLLGKKPKWLESLSKNNEIFSLYEHDIIKDNIELTLNKSENITHVIHMASIASPTYYRKYPVETIEGNIWGLKNLLEYFKNKKLMGLLFFSSSEIYGDPDKKNIPTKEEYRGNVASIGPRACYDESKRFGETLCYVYSEKYSMPISIARPFNNYGPGMNLNDKRVPADFAKSIVNNKDIEIFSDGSPTRTFCYITDAITGYLKVLLYGKFDYFNIGIDSPEISIAKLAEIYTTHGKKVFNYSGKVKLAPPPEKNYLKDNPNRRCPNISKAQELLNYSPSINVNEGVLRFLKYLEKEK